MGCGWGGAVLPRVFLYASCLLIQTHQPHSSALNSHTQHFIKHTQQPHSSATLNSHTHHFISHTH